MPTYEARWRGTYTEDWPEISRAIKTAADWRCARCHHPFDPATGRPLACDTQCDATRGRVNSAAIALIEAYPTVPSGPVNATWWHQAVMIAGPHAPLVPGLNYGCHHLDGHKSNNRWWNVPPCCNSCHLRLESRVILDRVFLFQHSPWFVPYACGFYAFYYGNGLEISRAEADATPHRWLALGQPWLYLSDAELATTAEDIADVAYRNASLGVRPPETPPDAGASPTDPPLSG